MVNWKPGTSTETLHLRAKLLVEIRQFFAERGVLEIDTPLLAPYTVTDVYIQSLETKFVCRVTRHLFPHAAKLINVYLGFCCYDSPVFLHSSLYSVLAQSNESSSGFID